MELMNDKSEESIERWMVCDTCSLQGKVGYFKEMGVNFKSTNDLQVCNNDHLLKEKHKTTNPSPPFWKTMVIFLKDGIEKHPKMPFSQVFQMIKDGKLKEGEQIWIYRDATTTRCNPVAVLMPYAHVVVYIGEKTGVNDEKTGVYEVVHVTKNMGWCPGISMGKIDRVNITDVIKPNDQGKY